MNAREQVLASIRAALGREASGRGAAAAVPPPPPIPQFGDSGLPTAERWQVFLQRLAAVGATAHDGTRDGGLMALQSLLAGKPPQRIAHSEAPQVLRLRGMAELAQHQWLPPTAGRAELFAADLGLCTAQWAIAATGTLVLDAAVETHRLASLLPPVHVALLPASRLLAELGEVLHLLGDPVSAAVTFITGPSRTADIELQLVVGVHGPRELHVILV
jgi:L-lactate utilization protein LutC